MHNPSANRNSRDRISIKLNGHVPHDFVVENDKVVKATVKTLAFRYALADQPEMTVIPAVVGVGNVAGKPVSFRFTPTALKKMLPFMSAENKKAAQYAARQTWGDNWRNAAHVCLSGHEDYVVYDLK